MNKKRTKIKNKDIIFGNYLIGISFCVFIFRKQKIREKGKRKRRSMERRSGGRRREEEEEK